MPRTSPTGARAFQESQAFKPYRAFRQMVEHLGPLGAARHPAGVLPWPCQDPIQAFMVAAVASLTLLAGS
jgi:hypothetical protein